MKRLVIGLSGGLGKHVAFTALLPKLKETYEEIYIGTPYASVFAGNPHVTKVNPFMNGDFYKNVMCQDDTLLVSADPYDHQDFVKKKIHLLEAWAQFCEIKVGNVMDLTTEIYLTEQEKYNVDRAKHEVNKVSKDKYILIQLNGGQSPLNYQENQNQAQFDFSKEGTIRFYPFDYYVGLVKALKKKYPGHTIIRYGLSNEPVPIDIDQDIMTLAMPLGDFKTYYELAKKAAAIVCIDSSLQHITAGIKKSVVIWGQTAPEHFGYNFHKNLRNEKRSTYAYFRPFGDPYDNVAFPNPDEVIEVLKNT